MSRISRSKKITATSAPTITVHDRIRAAEKSLLAGQSARVLISESDLEKIAELIESTGQTYAQILKKAVHLGVAVLQSPAAAIAPEVPQGGCMADFDDMTKEQFGGWVKPDPIPYSGFIPTEVADHYAKPSEPVADSVGVSAMSIALEGTV
jgi:hypothetical protein